VSEEIYGTSATITSKVIETGNVITPISGRKCSEYYKSTTMVPTDEAEIDAIY
jgi:hypothetical protein